MEKLKGICPECEVEISFRAKKPGQIINCLECDTSLEVVSISGKEAELDYSDYEED